MARKASRVATRAVRQITLLQREKKASYRKVSCKVAIDGIIALPQVRKTFTRIPELAEEMAGGLLTRLFVARLTPSQFAHYLERLNDIRKLALTASQFTPVRHGTTRAYYVLIGGERRLRAIKLFRQNGCHTCRKTNRGQPVPECECFHEHFPNAKVDVVLYVGIDAVNALDVQFKENNHVRVPPHEEAFEFRDYFLYLRSIEPEYTLAEFARRVGRSESSMRNALDFCELPERIRALVEKGVIRYGVALELIRLHKDGKSEDDLFWWAQRSVANTWRADQLHDQINAYFETRAEGQFDLLGVMDELAEAAARRATVRKPLEERTLRAIHAFAGYLRNLQRAQKEGLFDEKDGFLSRGSSFDVLRIVLGLLEEELTGEHPLFRRRGERKHHLATISAFRQAIDASETGERDTVRTG